MPNYRIPSNSDDDANGMWKLNAVQRARKGDEWPDPFIPASQYYIRTCTGNTTTITDGTTTNSGVANTGNSTWGYASSSSNCDAIGFSHQQTGSAANYKMNKISIGCGHGSWDGTFVDIYYYVRMYTGFGTATGTKIYDSGWIQTPQGANTIDGINFASTAYGLPSYSFMMLLLPDGTGSATALPTLSWNTGYTVAFAYGNSAGTGYSTHNREYNRAITLGNGTTVTQNHFNITSFADSAPFGGSNGTQGAGGGGYGQFPVLGYMLQG
jgi:hypothetical protein